MNIFLILFIVPCHLISISGIIDLQYVFRDYDTIELTLTCKTIYWCAIGFGNTYSNADLIRIANVSGVLTIQDLTEKTSTKFVAPTVDVQQDVYFIQGGINDTMIWATFQRLMQSDDPFDATIDYHSNIQMIYLMNENSIEFSTYTQYGQFQLLSYSCHYSCGACQGPFSNQCTLCTSTQVLNGICDSKQVNNLTTLYNSQTLIQDQFILYWEYDSNDIVLQIEIFTCDWFGLGFNSDKMAGTDMIYFTVSSTLVNGQTQYSITVDDMYGVKNTAPNSDIQLYGTQDWQIDGFQASSSMMTVRLHRQLKTSDEYDYDFSLKKDILAIYAYGYEDQPYHNANRGAFQFYLSQDKQSFEGSYWDQLIENGHVILMLLFWAIISDIGIFYGRQLKSYPKYIRVHGIIFLFITIVTYLFVFGMISNKLETIQQLGYQQTSIIVHFIFGVLILLALTIQVFLGLLARNNLESPNGTYLIYRVKIIHKFNGYLIYIVTKMQVFIGVYLYKFSLLWLLVLYYMLLFMIKFTIEMLYYLQVSAFTRKRVKYGYVEIDQNPLYESVIEKLNTGSTYREMQDDYPKLTYIILREAVYDVSDFNHPGGQYIFRKIRGREIGRYFYGGFPIKDTQLHKHSYFAINYIETRYIGDFRNETCPILYTIPDTKPSHIWRLRQIKQMGNSIALFTFTNKEIKVNETLPGVSWFGRYFYIKPYAAGLDLQERPYSVVQCLSDANIKYRSELIEYFKQKDWTQPLPTITQLSTNIQFAIKKYNFNLSRFIHNSSHKRYEITGPYGFGLELDSKTQGVHYVFCQGTGVLPFLDLCDYLLKKCLFKVMIESGLANESNYSQLEKFKLILCVSSKNQVCGYPILQDLEYLCKQFKIGIFELHITKQHYDKKYIQDMLRFQATKIYVCGFQKFEDDVIEILQECGVDQKFIVQI